MKKLCLLLTILLFLPTLALAVQINEVMYDLPGADSGREWIEIFQEADECTDLTDWKFYEAETNHRLTVHQGEMTLCSGDYAIIADKPDKFLTDHPGFSGNLIDSSFSLSNTGETLALKDPDGEVIDSITYSSGTGAKGNGKSLERNATGWFESLDNATPGAQNSIVLQQEESQSQQEEQQEPAYAPPTNYSPLIDFSIIGRSNHVPPGSSIETVVSVSSNYLVPREAKLCAVIETASACRSITLQPDESREVRLYNSLEPNTTGNLTLTVELHEGAAIKKKSTWLEVIEPISEEIAEPAEENRTGPTGALVVEIDEKDIFSRIISKIKDFISSVLGR